MNWKSKFGFADYFSLNTIQRLVESKCRGIKEKRPAFNSCDSFFLN